MLKAKCSENNLKYVGNSNSASNSNVHTNLINEYLKIIFKKFASPY